MKRILIPLLLLAACGSTTAIQTQAPAVKASGTITAVEALDCQLTATKVGPCITINASGYPNGSTLTVILEDGPSRTFYVLMPNGSGSLTQSFKCGGSFKAFVGNLPGNISEVNVHPNCNGGTTSPATSIPPSSTSVPTTQPIASSVAPTTSTSTPSASTVAVTTTPSTSVSPSSTTPVVVTAVPNSSPATSGAPADGPPPTGLVIPPTCLQKCTP